MKVNAAEFVTGAASPRQFPPSVIPEVAFAGKSNVGKSSLLNALLGRRNLVKTSSEPGKTRQINFFRINDRFHCVDLPGYGFARAPKAVRDTWEGLIGAYLTGRPSLRGVVLLIDPRHEPGPLDRRMKDWLDELGLPTVVVATKMDKLNRSQAAGRLRAVAAVLGLSEPPLPFSAQTGQGRDALWRHLEGWLRPGRERPAQRAAP